MGFTRLTPLLILAASSIAAGCATQSVDRSAYVHANKKILRSAPRVPGARLVNSYTTAIRNGNGWPEGSGPITAYATSDVYAMPRGLGAAAVIHFYERRLRHSGWRLRAWTTREGTFRRGRALLSVGVTTKAFSLTVDHRAYPA